MKQNINKKNTLLSELDLDERSKKVLKAIVQLYIVNAQPVGSRLLSKHLQKDLNLSPASIRNIVAELEEMNLVEQTHISSGRIPTDLGYRFFVESINPRKIPSEKERQLIINQLKTVDINNPEELLRTATKVLGFLAKYLSIVIVPEIQQIRIQKIEIVELSPNRLLFVLALESNFIRTLTIETNFEIESSQIPLLSSFINEKIAGKTLEFVRHNFNHLISDYQHKDTPLIKLFVSLVDTLFGKLNEEERAWVEGAHYLLEYPEFEQPLQVKKVIQLIENTNLIVEVLKKWQTINSNLTILIGSETSCSQLRDFTIIASNVRLSGIHTTIGILGPKRMNYTKVIPLVRYFSNALSNFLYS